jgi:hypothetical protein
MKTFFPFLIIALSCAAPVPPLTKEQNERIVQKIYAETGKGWKVNATARGASSEVFIHLLQSKMLSHKGEGAAFLVDGRFPTPKGDADLRLFWKSTLLLKSALVQQGFCPKSDRVCKAGASWTARQTETEEETYFPVVDSPILLETQVVFQNSGECDSFIAEWNIVCDSWRLVLPVTTYLLKSDFDSSTARFIEVWKHGLTRAARHEGLVSLIALVQGLKNTAPLRIIEEIIFRAGELFNVLDQWKEFEISLRQRMMG